MLSEKNFWKKFDLEKNLFWPETRPEKHPKPDVFFNPRSETRPEKFSDDPTRNPTRKKIFFLTRPETRPDFFLDPAQPWWEP